MAERIFDFVKTTHDGRALSAFRIDCHHDGCKAHQLMVQTGAKRMPPTAATQYFRKHGWLVGRTARQDRCPDHHRQRRANPKVSIMDKPQAAEPRTMTREDRRIIMAKLDDVYASETDGYVAPWTDSAVARDLGVPRAWVSEMREEFYGPAMSNAEFDEFLEKASPVIEQCRQLIRNASAQLDEARRLSGRADELERIAKQIEKEIGGGRKAG